ncbi:hypothetical protein PENANT_c023G00099 [Penicillium antarcticum]|uniref:Protein BIG1 n=1 Tax=Penicillium antarcticum TaxID=416450 RepID=A0A1V6PYV3_9EURO|nr:uncharacterized protein N7508_006168 [Penicillium antarcticum]KAJ5301305.1 hypothetical protein N7508_006168 [Penicillium antarcticum]OQD82198.1 hypothetical protein PENANT_c023G00099 [Penicillium antarcticum]
MRHSPSVLALVAFLFTVTQSATSYPISTSKWVKADQFDDNKAHGSWRSFEKDGLDLLPGLSNAKHNPIPSWSNGYTAERGLDHPYTYKPSPVLAPATLDIMPEQLHNTQEHESGSIDGAEQRQNHYSELLSYLHAKNALNKDPGHSTPASFSLASSAGHSVSFFSYRLSWPTLGSSTSTMPRYPLPGIFTTVIILLAMVWIAIFTIGLVELGNYFWARRREAQGDEEEVEHGEEESVRLDSLKSVPFTVIFPSNRIRSNSEREEDEYQVAVFTDADLNSGSSSDEDHQLI